MVYDNKLRYYLDEPNCADISDENSAVRPFAQTDVINTILSGIDPELNNTFLNNFGSLFDKYNKFLLNTYYDSNPYFQNKFNLLTSES